MYNNDLFVFADQFQSLIQFSDVNSAQVAKQVTDSWCFVSKYICSTRPKFYETKELSKVMLAHSNLLCIFISKFSYNRYTF